jgi:cobalt-zinc-cadmium efflux system membrane fusion protein
MIRNIPAFLLLAAAVAVGPASGAHSEETQNSDEVRLTESQVKLIDLQTAVAEPGKVGTDLVVNGEITADQNRTLDVLPRAAGTVREVKGQLGETVATGTPLAMIESSTVAEAEAAYLAARSKADLTRIQASREEGLWRKGISSQQDYQVARQASDEANIQLRTAERQLRLLGFDPANVDNSDAAPGPVRLTVAAPINGTLIERHVTVGDQVTPSSAIFRLANLETVWAIASVFEKDIGRVAVGQSAKVSLAYSGHQFEGRVTWVSDVLDEKTRTLKIRIELSNPDRLLKPGSFARVILTPLDQRAGLVIPAAALQWQKDQPVVFIVEREGLFKRQPVTIDGRSPDAVAITAGLNRGERVVTNGSFDLLSELGKSAFAGDD